MTAHQTIESQAPTETTDRVMTGAEIVVVPDDRHGQIDLAALERAIVEAIDTFTPTEWANYFAAAEYDAD